jgi:hypothetical protein
MLRRLLVCATLASCTTVLAGCEPSVEWSPKHPEQPEYPAEPQDASRDRQAPACPRIGVVHAEGDPDYVIEHLAHEAAAHGGTDYTIEGDNSEGEVTTKSASTTVGNTTLTKTRSRVDTTRAIWAIVYRCKGDAPE